MTDIDKLNPDGSILSRAEAKIKEIELQLEMLSLRKAALDRDAERSDKYLTQVKWMFGAASGLVSLVCISLSFFGFKSVNAIKEEVLQIIPVAVQNELRFEGELKASATDLVEGLEMIQGKYESFKEWSETLADTQNSKSVVSTDRYVASADVHYAYSRTSEISARGNEATEQERREAAVLLDALIDLSVNGSADPNTIFNASVNADRLNFTERASKLSTLAYEWQPSTSHRAKMLQNQDVLGVSYSFDRGNAELVALDITPEEARAEAWSGSLALLAKNPRIEGEQAYSRAQNIAVRNRSRGYYTQLIDVIEQAVSIDPDAPTSYAFKSLAELYAWRSSPGWESDFWRSVEMAVSRLAQESPRSSWYGHSVRELIEEASELDAMERLIEIFAQNGLDSDEILAAASATSR